jgi:AraC family transcriptional regulator
MDGHFGEALAVSQAGQKVGQSRSADWMHHALALLDAAVGHLRQGQAAHGAIVEATLLLRRQVDPPPVEGTREDGKERLLAWQARKVLDHIDRHIIGRVPVADLCALVRRSEAHFSRSFKGTFGYSPHAFVVRRRVELAAKYMLQTDMSLSDIALGCGFADQAHLCKQFRAVTGETPAAWRRARRTQDADISALPAPLVGHGPGTVAQSSPRAPAVDTA